MNFNTDRMSNNTQNSSKILWRLCLLSVPLPQWCVIQHRAGPKRKVGKRTMMMNDDDDYVCSKSRVKAVLFQMRIFHCFSVINWLVIHSRSPLICCLRSMLHITIAFDKPAGNLSNAGFHISLTVFSFPQTSLPQIFMCIFSSAVLR